MLSLFFFFNHNFAIQMDGKSHMQLKYTNLKYQAKIFFEFPLRFFCLSLSLPSFSSTFPLLHHLPPSFPLYPGPQSEDGLLAGSCRRGGRASKSLMRCLSPPSRLDRSSQQRITTTTTPHCTVLHTILSACCCCCCCCCRCCCCC